MKKYIYGLIVLLLLLGGCTDKPIPDGDLRASQGVLDLQSLDLESDRLISLDGEWSFYWKQMMIPNKTGRAGNHRTYEVLPDTWESETGTMQGFATYTLKIQLPEEMQGQVLGFYIPFQYSAYSLWVDGKRVAVNGIVGRSQETSKPAFVKQLAYFTPSKTEFILTMHVSNFDHQLGGASNPILFGNAQAVSNHYSKLVAFNLFLVGGILLVGISQLCLFLFRRTEKAFLFFGVMSILIAVRALFIGPLFITVLFPEFSWIWQSRLEFLIMYTGFIMYLMFLKCLYPEEFSNKVLKAMIALSVMLSGITIFSQPVFYRPLFNYFLVIALLGIVYIVYVLILAIRKRRPTAIINMTASILFMISVINDALISLYWLEGEYLTTYGFFLYILIQSINLSRNYARKFQESENLADQLKKLNNSLDEKIKARTEQLEVMNGKLYEMTLLDGLTGINNRRFFDEKIMEAALDSMHEPMTLLLIDLDEFKKYNDTYGHLAGDDMIKFCASLLKKEIGAKGYVARYGGEEFAVILPKTAQEQGYLIAEKIRSEMEMSNKEHIGNLPKQVATLSIGGSSSSHHRHQNPEDWLKLADLALYQSKESGRNRVTML